MSANLMKCQIQLAFQKIKAKEEGKHMLFDYNRLQKEQKGKILGKWKPFLRGINDDYLKENTAMLLENEAQ